TSEETRVRAAKVTSFMTGLLGFGGAAITAATRPLNKPRLPSTRVKAGQNGPTGALTRAVAMHRDPRRARPPPPRAPSDPSRPRSPRPGVEAARRRGPRLPGWLSARERGRRR